MFVLPPLRLRRQPLTKSASFTAQFEQTLGRLENAENQVEDLKQQLDDALGAEDMVVQLTERTLENSEVCLSP